MARSGNEPLDAPGCALPLRQDFRICTPESGSRVLTGLVPMGRDLAVAEELTLRVVVQLPDGGSSEASVAVVAMDDPGFWVGRAIHRRTTEDTDEIIQAENLRFDYNPDRGRYER